MKKFVITLIVLANYNVMNAMKYTFNGEFEALGRIKSSMSEEQLRELHNEMGIIAMDALGRMEQVARKYENELGLGDKFDIFTLNLKTIAEIDRD